MTERPTWAEDAARFVQRLGAQRTSAATPVQMPSSVDEREQLALTGIRFDLAAVDLDSILIGSVERARHRFRAALPSLIWNAAALEGNTFTLPEVRTLLDGTTVAGKALADERQIIALSEAYNDLDRQIGEHSFALDKPTSDRLHAMLAEHEAIEAGHFRGEGQVGGGGAVQLSSGEIVAGLPPEALMGRWQGIQEHLELVDDPRAAALVYNAAATRAQFYFDGNKRTARLMSAGMLMRHGYDAINVPNARRYEYNIALDHLFSTDDATPLLRFLASCAAAPAAA